MRRVTSARAAGDGTYRSCLIACSTLARVAGRTFGRSLSTRETVWCDTPASRATSKIVATRALSSRSLTRCCAPAPRRRRARYVDYPARRAVSPAAPQRRLAVSTFCRMMKTSSSAPMKIFVHHDDSVPSNVMIVWMTPSTSTPSTDPSTNP